MKKTPTKEELMLSMADLCARSEQCSFDISKKLRTKGLGYSDAQEVVENLKARGFIDNYRYARSFARDKVRFSAWGKRKIRLALISKRIDSATIDEAFEEIDAEDYADALRRAALSKARQLDLNEYQDRLKLYKYLISRGFESSLSSLAVKNLARNENIEPDI